MQSDKPGVVAGSKSAPADNFKTLPMPELQQKLGSSSQGLSQAEADKRLAQYGPNEIAEKKTNEVLVMLRGHYS